MTVFTESESESEAVSKDVYDPTVDGVVESLTPEDLDLDIRFVESGPIVEELMRPTDDGCGRTCESACTSCP